MKIEVVLLPAHLNEGHLRGRSVVVFDVLRATTTMTSALAAGVKEIRIFPTIDAVRSAIEKFDGSKLSCGEEAGLRPAGFDLGNSPGDFSRGRHAGKTAFMSTTNGTKAILAAGEAAEVFVAGLVNARAAAEAVAERGRDVTLLCAGTNGAIAMEDVIGAGAVVQCLLDRGGELVGDVAEMAVRVFEQSKHDLPGALLRSQGGRNVVRVGLKPDLIFAARLDVLDVVGRVINEEGLVKVVATQHPIRYSHTGVIPL